MANRRVRKTSSHGDKTQILAPPMRETVRSAAGKLPASYPVLLEHIKSRIRAAQVKAVLSVNRELIELYWSIGRDIVSRQEVEGWGKSVVERLAADLQAEFPGVGGFSSRNIWLMRAFFVAWRDDSRKLKQAVSETGRSSILQQPAAQFTAAKLPQAVAEIPWFHNVVLIEKLKDRAQRLWYAEQTIANGLSRSMLVHWIESGLHQRQGKALTNFKATLPPPQSDLASELVKDRTIRGLRAVRGLEPPGTDRLHPLSEPSGQPESPSPQAAAPARLTFAGGAPILYSSTPRRISPSGLGRGFAFYATSDTAAWPSGRVEHAR